MPQIHILAVGKLREPHWREAASAYLLRLRRGYEVIETVVKDGDASLGSAERMEVEGNRILQALKPHLMSVCLDENGKMFSSKDFAAFLRQSFDRGRTPCFIIGGAYGLSATVTMKASNLISLSPMTFPHELARVLLLEQLYRADAIMHGRPYHHA